MATVLYITAHPHDHHSSYSMAVGEAFRTAYQHANPQDKVEHLDLYKIHVPHIDADVFSGWGKLASGTEFSQLSPDEQTKVNRLNEIVDQFISADKYVFVNPMWNFSFPPILKAYTDAVCVAGKTFRYTAEGPVGLLTDKKVLHIQANGGIYSEGPAKELESGSRYLRIVSGFWGITSFEALFVEGMNAQPDRAQAIKEEAIERAKQLAATF
ncbi:FMN-dependent NADH-azoreductase [Paenibacillus medicaginis]|uniref:FMN dependent NADH:quinone oxidoreductase n=1 Tax=Paenibacillus medicaginis TaxID=1470560 RepID=A0ABV5BW01_9BACL